MYTTTTAKNLPAVAQNIIFLSYTMSKTIPNFDNLNGGGIKAAPAKNVSAKLKKLVEQPEPIPHSQVLQTILRRVQTVNFSELTGKNELKKHDYIVVCIEQIINTARTAGLGLCHRDGSSYLYNGAFWAKINEGELKSFLGECAEKMGAEKYLARYHKTREEYYKQFQTLANLPIIEQPGNTAFINLQNGTLAVTHTGANLLPFNKDQFFTYQLPFAYDKTATAPIFAGHLNKVLPDIQCQNVLAEFLGSVFIKNNVLKLEKVLFLSGDGGNGKSVIFDTTTALLGSQNVSSYSLEDLADEKGYHVAEIENKLVNYCSEFGGKAYATKFKQMASGEPLPGRSPYEKPRTITNYAKLIFNANILPKDVEQSHAYFRRLLILPFTVTIKANEDDKSFASRIIENELSGVLNWVLIGLERLLQQRKFSDCAAADEALTKYKNESNPVLIFLTEFNYKPSEKSYIDKNALYTRYTTFCSENGYNRCNSLNFKHRLIQAGYVIKRHGSGDVVYTVENTTF